MIKFLFYLITLLILVGCSDNSSNTESPTSEFVAKTPAINYTVISYFPHDSTLFTEGLLFHDGKLYESTGSPEELPQTKSLIGISDLKTGNFIPKIEIDRTRYFGEGIVFLHDKLYQLTYKNKMGFIYDAKTFERIGEFTYSNEEGWGLTTDGASIIMSDGTHNLTFLDPAEFKPKKILSITENGEPVDRLNELEFIRGFIYANIWMEDFIVKIDPSNGKVVGRLNLSTLTSAAKKVNPNAEVLNGIAYDSVLNKIFVTGKLWANFYEIEFTH